MDVCNLSLSTFSGEGEGCPDGGVRVILLAGVVHEVDHGAAKRFGSAYGFVLTQFREGLVQQLDGGIRVNGPVRDEKGAGASIEDRNLPPKQLTPIPRQRVRSILPSPFMSL
jgi:hypothetical protein